ncbi:MAG TPA: DNA-formamidopyrimidine glycosylase family protein [Planctomycetota bacterium]
MPELPEVEANLRNFAAWCVGRRITGARPAALARRLAGREVKAVERRGKWMLARLGGGAGLGLHLGMTGKIARAEGDVLPRFTRAVFEMSDGGRVCFVDLRRFGRIRAEPSYEALLRRPEIAAIGPDALHALDLRHLREAFASTSRTVKETIMDQRVLGGLGNIYAAEALWRARIHPATAARAIDAPALRALARGIRWALRRGLREFPKGEVPAYVEEGAPNPFFVYARAGEPCRRCRARLQGMVLGGRSTVFCPRCQLSRRSQPG